LYKLEIPPTQEQIDLTVETFKAVDACLSGDEFYENLFEGSFLDDSYEDESAVLRTANHIVNTLMTGFDPHDIAPRHGPGAVATGEKSHQKHKFKRLFWDLEKEYPFTEYFLSGPNHLGDYWQLMQKTLICQGAGTAKVVLVPKDSRGPRLISCEPLEYQWIQQGLGNAMRHHIERRGSLSYRQINFADQTVNRSLALQGSLGAGWVTLDMKDASDRVSLGLVRSLWSNNPDILRCLEAARTPETQLPNGDKLTLRKFAPMGSNLCFPVESIVFWALAVATIVNKDKGKWRRCKPCHAHNAYMSAIKRASKRVFVYGDDIVCRSEDYRDLLDIMPHFGLMFNADKCCVGNSFRESCGMDAYKGVPVQPLRLKRLWSVSRKQDALTLASYNAFSNAAYCHGLHRVSELITPLIESEVGPLPVMAWDCSKDPYTFQGISALVRIEHGTREGIRIGQPGFKYKRAKTREYDYHGILIRCLLPVSDSISVPAGDWSMVLRRLNSPGREAPGIFPLAHRVTLKWAWIRTSS
jgi:hypothetical protein